MPARKHLVLILLTLVITWPCVTFLFYLENLSLSREADIFRELGWLAILSTHAVLLHAAMEGRRGRDLVRGFSGPFGNTVVAAFIIHVVLRWIWPPVALFLGFLVAKAVGGLVAALLFNLLGIYLSFILLASCLAVTPGVTYGRGLQRCLSRFTLNRWTLLMVMAIILQFFFSLEGEYRWYLRLGSNSLTMLMLLVGHYGMLLHRLRMDKDTAETFSFQDKPLKDDQTPGMDSPRF